jgi:alpha-acetolactate decarboxylase
MAAHAETQTQAYKATAKGQTPSVSKDREAVKAAILAQYGASVVEESEEEESDEGRISEIMSCEESVNFCKSCKCSLCRQT